MASPDRTALIAYHAELAAAFNARRCGCGAQADCVVIARGGAWDDLNCCLACMRRVVAPDGAVLRSEAHVGARRVGSGLAAKGGSVTGPPLVYQETP